MGISYTQEATAYRKTTHQLPIRNTNIKRNRTNAINQVKTDKSLVCEL